MYCPYQVNKPNTRGKSKNKSLPFISSEFPFLLHGPSETLRLRRKFHQSVHPSGEFFAFKNPLVLYPQHMCICLGVSNFLLIGPTSYLDLYREIVPQIFCMLKFFIIYRVGRSWVSHTLHTNYSPPPTYIWEYPHLPHLRLRR